MCFCLFYMVCIRGMSITSTARLVGVLAMIAVILYQDSNIRTVSLYQDDPKKKAAVTIDITAVTEKTGENENVSSFSTTRTVPTLTPQELSDYITTTPRCQTMESVPGRWVRVPQTVGWAFTGMRYHGKSCRYPWLTDGISPCLKNKRVLFIGNSHIRMIMKTLCYLLRLQGCEKMETNKHLPHKFISSPANFTMQFFFFSFKLDSTAMQYLSEPYDVVIVNQGAWDMLLNDTDSPDYVDRVSNVLQIVRGSYPTHVPIVFYNVHKIHPSVKPKVGAPSWEGALLQRLTECFSVTRQAAYRAMNRCAFHRSAIANLHIWDSFEMTNSEIARMYTTPDGHHYLGGVMESQLMMFLNWFCLAPTTRKEDTPYAVTQECLKSNWTYEHPKYCYTKRSELQSRKSKSSSKKVTVRSKRKP